MVKITTIFGLALVACTSAIPTIMTDAGQGNTELVPPCMCGNFIGNHCGERASGKGIHKPLSGTCNAKTLFYCPSWAVNTSGIADAVQAPCWTNKCYQSTKIGDDSCTVPVNPLNTTKPAKPAKSATPIKLINAEREELVPEVTPAVITDCTCGNSTGHFCGERASSSDGHITGNCNATSLYYCSLWAANNTGFADLVQAPCWTNQCHQASTPGYDSCTPIKSDVHMREDLLRKAKPKFEIAPRADCNCGSHPGWFCGNRTITPRTKDDSKSLSGNCNPDSVYYCIGAGRQAQIYQSQCPADHCLIQPAIIGFDYCSTKDIAVTTREEVVPDDESKSKPDCRCGSQTGLFCGNRTITPAYRDDSKSLNGNCNPNSVYYCSEDGAKTQRKAYAYQSKCSTGICFIHPDGLGEDYCKGPDTVTIVAKREKLVPEATSLPVPDCRCSSETGLFCGKQATLEGSGKFLTGDCTVNSIYYCPPQAAQSKNWALISNPCSHGHCVMNGVGGDYCKLPDTTFAEREEVVPATATNPLPVCTCGKDSGYFCGDRATAAIKKNEHRALTGNCTTGPLYYCDDSNLTSPQMAKLWESTCSGSGKCYQSVETGYDSCHH